MIRSGYSFFSESFFRPLIAMKKEMRLIVKTFIDFFVFCFVHVETKNVSDRDIQFFIQEAHWELY